MNIDGLSGSSHSENDFICCLNKISEVFINCTTKLVKWGNTTDLDVFLKPKNVWGSCTSHSHPSLQNIAHWGHQMSQSFISRWLLFVSTDGGQTHALAVLQAQPHWWPAADPFKKQWVQLKNYRQGPGYPKLIILYSWFYIWNFTVKT